MRHRAAKKCRHTADPAEVDRRLLIATETIQVRDNLCARTDPALSEPTAPMASFEIVFPLTGLWVRRVDGRDLAVEPNSIHFINKDEVHRVHHPAGCGDRNTGISVAPDVLEEVSSLNNNSAFDRGRGVFRIRCRPARNAELAAHTMLRRALLDPTVEALAVEEVMLHFLAVTMSGTDTVACPSVSRSGTARAHHRLALRVIEVLERRLRHTLTLAQVAREASTSPYHMARVFRAQTGLSVHLHLRRRRVVAAAQDLLHTDLTLSAIADRTGFADAPHLCRTFRRILGANAQALRTLEWREALRRMERLATEHRAE